MTDSGFSPRPAHWVVLAALAVLAALLWPGPGGDLLFWLYQVALVAVLLAGAEFRKSFAIPGEGGRWGAAERGRLALVQGAFFMALMLVVGADGAQATPAAWLVSAVIGGLVFGLLAAFTGAFGPTRDPARHAHYDRRHNRMNAGADRLRLYAMPVVMIGIAPMLILPGGLFAPAIGIPIYLLLVVAIAEPPPLYPRTSAGERAALWTHHRHLFLRMGAAILMALLLWQRL